MSVFTKKCALITGASGGIGKAIAEHFLKNNYIVIGTYLNNVIPLYELSERFPSDFFYFKCDLSDFNEAKVLIDTLQSKHLTVDVLVNNAGISHIGLLQDIDFSTWNTLWNTNVTSALALSSGVIPLFLKNGGGKIINISSVWGSHGASCEVAYSATKGALNSFTKALAKELAPSNIQVNAISCGFIKTKMNAHLSEEEIIDIVHEIPASRLGTPQDVADAVFAVANSGSYMTGQIIDIDGGWQI